MMRSAAPDAGRHDIDRVVRAIRHLLVLTLGVAIVGILSCGGLAILEPVAAGETVGDSLREPFGLEVANAGRAAAREWRPMGPLVALGVFTLVLVFSAWAHVRLDRLQGRLKWSHVST